VFENRVLRRIFGPQRAEVKEEWRKLHKWGFIICTHHQISLSRVAQSVLCLTTDWTAEVPSPTGAEDFASNLCVQTGLWDPPSLLYNGYRE
jgi:ABC-type sugar transport system ATPase subunit